MQRVLIFNEEGTAADVGESVHDVYCVPVSRFKGFTNPGTDNTVLEMRFEGLTEGMADGDDSSTDRVALTITANKHVEAMKDIVNGMTGTHSTRLVVIADALNSDFISSYITACTISVATAD